MDAANTDYVSIATNLGLVAAQLIALTTAFLTALFGIRQVNVVIESRAYKTVGWYLLFSFITVFLWIVISFAEVLGFVNRSKPDLFQKGMALLELITTTVYLLLLLKACMDLFNYIRRTDR